MQVFFITCLLPFQSPLLPTLKISEVGKFKLKQEEAISLFSEKFQPSKGGLDLEGIDFKGMVASANNLE